MLGQPIVPRETWAVVGSESNLFHHHDWTIPAGGFPQEQTTPSGIMAAFVKVCERWNLGPAEQVQLLGFPPEDPIGGGLLTGAINATSQDIRERMGYIIGIRISLNGLFDESHEAELAWLHQPRTSLDGNTPIQHMLKRRMINVIQVSDILTRERGL